MDSSTQVFLLKANIEKYFYVSNAKVIAIDSKYIIEYIMLIGDFSIKNKILNYTVFLTWVTKHWKYASLRKDYLTNDTKLCSVSAFKTPPKKTV